MPLEWKLAVVFLWLVVIVLLLVVLATVRQVGVLLLRMGPRGPLALSSGPRVGVSAPRVDGLDFVVNEKKDGTVKKTVLLFTAPKCPSCKEILPAFKAVAKSYEGKAKFHVLEQDIFEKPFSTYNIKEVPYAVAIDSNGVVVSKGVVNNIDHIEEMLKI